MLLLDKIVGKVIPSIAIRKVDAFIVGAQKAGTTALYKYLTDHPQVRGTSSEFKETGFFNHDSLYKKGYAFYHKTYFPRQTVREWLFNNILYLESAPGYLSAGNAPQRIAKYNPKAKLIFILREPVSRAISQWNMFMHLRNSPEKVKERLYYHHIHPAGEQIKEGWRNFMYGSDLPDFRSHIENEIHNLSLGESKFPNILRNGLYFNHIRKYFQYFVRKQLLIEEQEQIRGNTAEKLCEIRSFLGIKKYEWKNLQPHHKRTYIVEVDEEVKAILQDFYRQPNENLFSLIDMEFAWPK